MLKLERYSSTFVFPTHDYVGTYLYKITQCVASDLADLYKFQMTYGEAAYSTPYNKENDTLRLNSLVRVLLNGRKVAEIRRILIPLHNSSHWHLLLVDILGRKLYHINSIRRMDTCKATMRTMIIFPVVLSVANIEGHSSRFHSEQMGSAGQK